MIQHCLPGPCVPCLPPPWTPMLPWSDPELDCLRRQQRAQMIEEEKERLREWLRRHGRPQPCMPGIVRPLMPYRPCPCPPPPQGIGDVLSRLG